MAALQNLRMQRIQEILQKVVDLGELERSALLDRECAGDMDLRAEVESLLAIPSASAAGKTGDGKERNATEERAGTTTQTNDVPLPGSRREIGPYRLLEKLGEGGMGEVWLAEQTTPVHRRIALKLIRAGMDSKHVVARFEAEREALALMQHSSIARIVDAGATKDGQPYFVMDYVPGESITSYCDHHRLTTEERLRLFLPVCGAVQHAHQKGIIHRDLKPSNVLVTIQDGKPLPKIIDFGVAKATARPLTERTLFTELGAMIGTPEYMSPEQADLTGLDVDTRTDVYSLGVLLYELLTGVLPFEASALREAGFDEIRRKIREDDPPRPSTRIALLGEKATDSAARRRTDPGKLRSGLRGDLDWLVMKALEKDRARRYGSAVELSADIERHLADQPVLAGPPSAKYRAEKFIRRHRVGVVATAAIAAALLAGAVVSTIGFVRASRAEARAKNETEAAQQVSEFLIGLFKVSDPSESRGNSVTAREVLDKGSEKILTELQSQPELQARLLHTMADVYVGLGLYPRSTTLAESALEVSRKAFGPEDSRTVFSKSELAVRYYLQARYKEAEKLAREALETQLPRLGPDHEDTLKTTKRLALALGAQGRFAEAEPLYVRTLEGRRRVLGPEHRATLASMQDLARVYSQQGRWQAAGKITSEVLAILRSKFGPSHPDTLSSMSYLAHCYIETGRLEEAEALERESLEISRRVLGPGHPETIQTLNGLGYLLNEQGRYAEAETLIRSALQAQLRVLGADNPDTLSTMNNLAYSCMGQRRFEEAIQLRRSALDGTRKALGADHERTIGTGIDLAEVYYNWGHFAETAPLLRDAADHLLAIKDPNPRMRLGALEMLARTYRGMGRDKDAEALLRDISDQAAVLFGVDNREAILWRYELAGELARQGQSKEALEQLRQAVQAGYRRADEMEVDPDLKALLDSPEFTRLVAAAWKNAEAHERKGLEGLRLDLGPEHRETLKSMDRLARALVRIGHTEEAERLLKEALATQVRLFGEKDRDSAETTFELACLASVRGETAQAVDWLRRSVNAGFRSVDKLTADPDLKPLRGTAEYQQLISMANRNAAEAGKTEGADKRNKAPF